jgi:hypothetical protein
VEATVPKAENTEIQSGTQAQEFWLVQILEFDFEGTVSLALIVMGSFREDGDGNGKAR